MTRAELEALSDEELRLRRVKANDLIDAAYWRFTRQRRAPPPSMAEPNAYAERATIDAILRERRNRPQN